MFGWGENIRRAAVSAQLAWGGVCFVALLSH